MTGKGRRMDELGRGLEGGEKVGGGGGVGSGGRKEEEGGVENFEMRDRRVFSDRGRDR